MTAEELLSVLRSTTFVPGSNLRGERAGAPWSFLLPTLELRRVLVVGRPDNATDRTLRRLATDVAVVEGLVDRRATGDYDLVAITSTVTADAPELVRGAARLVGPGGAVFLMARGPAIVDALAAATGSGLDVVLHGDVRPARGELVAALSGGEPGIAPLVERLGIMPGRASRPVALPGWLPRVVARAARRVVRVRRRITATVSDRVGTETGRRVIVARRPVAGAADQLSPSAGAKRRPDPLPDWLADLAGAAEQDVRGRPWALVARGDYDSQKPVFVIADPSGTQPELVVKVTRNPIWNERLAIEGRALDGLAPLAAAWRHLVVPRVAFAGIHAGLAVLAETAVTGRPFSSALGGPERHRGFAAAVDALSELATSTRRSATGSAHAAAIEPFVDRFAAIWSITDRERAALRRDLDAVATIDDLPAVMVHGDAGTWNMLIGDDGRVAVLDWEAAEEAGPPLWDIERLIGGRAMLEAAAGRPITSFGRARRHLIDGSALTPALGGALRRSADAIGVTPAAIAPLVRLAWVARALKEVNRLRPDELDRGVHQRLVRLSITTPGEGWRMLTRAS